MLNLKKETKCSSIESVLAVNCTFKSLARLLLLLPILILLLLLLLLQKCIIQCQIVLLKPK